VVRCFEGARRIAAGENVGAQYGLADETMSLVAVIRREGDKPGELPKTVVVPVGMAQDVGMSGYLPGQSTFAACYAAPPAPIMAMPQASGIRFSLLKAIDTFKGGQARSRSQPPAAPPSEPDNLPIELASRMEPDGGMPGESIDQRIERTIAAIMFFEREGSTEKAGPFRAHVGRLYAFLRSNGWDGKLAIRGELEQFVRTWL
jgi:hypothetical protein